MKKYFLIFLSILLILPYVCGCGLTPPEDTPVPDFRAIEPVLDGPIQAAAPTAEPEESPEKPAAAEDRRAAQTAPNEDAIQMLIDGMSDEELVGQMVMCGFEGTEAPSGDFVEFMQTYKVGNIILFGWNTDSFEQTGALIDEVEALNTTDIPMSFAIDVEGGNVLRFSWDPHINAALTLGTKNDLEFTYEQYRRIGRQLSEIGVTIDLAPVLDIAEIPEETFLGQRMFGSDPEITVPHAQAAIRGLHDGGVKSFGKHFPGHGQTITDPHAELPELGTGLEELHEYDFTMFQGAIEADVDGMLVGHLFYPNIDSENITSVSKTFITDILREEMRFYGVIMSDDLRMQAIASTVGIGEGAVRFIEAGGDMVLIGRYVDKQRAVCEAIYEALDSGRITRERLEESVYRILRMKGYWP